MKIPQGKLIPIGGNEAKDLEENEEHVKGMDVPRGILKEVIAEMRGSRPGIEILPVASAHQEEIVASYRDAFKKLGHKINVMIVQDKKELDSEANLNKLKQADGIFITGGNQARLKKMLDGTRFIEILKERYYNEDFVIAGTSAGAMILSEYMIDPGGDEESVLKNTVRLTKGFSFIPGTIIDTHFFERGRFPRLAESLLKKKKFTGIGISEDTALIVTEGNEVRAIGSGTVTIMEIDENSNTNYDEINDKEPVYIENLKVHILSRGAAYLLKEKKFLIL